MNKIQQVIFKMFGGLTTATIQQLRRYNDELKEENTELKRIINTLNKGMNTWLESEGLITVDSQDLYESKDPIEKWNFIKNAIEDQLAELTKIGTDLDQEIIENERTRKEINEEIERTNESVKKLTNTREIIQKDQEITKQKIVDLKYNDIIDISNFEELI
jgi:chromosome segregation ATPase